MHRTRWLEGTRSRGSPTAADPAGHSPRGAVRLPIPVVDQAQRAVQQTVGPCLTRTARARLDPVRVTATVQVYNGAVVFRDVRLDEADKTTDVALLTCAKRRLGAARVRVDGVPEGALAVLSAPVFLLITDDVP